MRLSVQKEAGTVMNERLPLVLTVLGPPYYMPYNGAPRITLGTPPCDSSSSDRDDTEQVSPDSGQDEIIACPAILPGGYARFSDGIVLYSFAIDVYYV